MLIKSFHCSSSTLQTTFANNVAWSQPESKAMAFQKFKSGALQTWIKTHEKHLADNGNNGHYVGNKVRKKNMVGMKDESIERIIIFGIFFSGNLVLTLFFFFYFSFPIKYRLLC